MVALKLSILYRLTNSTFKSYINHNNWLNLWSKCKLYNKNAHNKKYPCFLVKLFKHEIKPCIKNKVHKTSAT